MQRCIREDDERTTEYGKTDTVAPERQHVKAKGRQDGRAGNLNVDAVLVVDEREIAHLVDDEAFEAVVEDG